MNLPEDDIEALREIRRLRSDGRLFAELEPGRSFVLMAYELYPNGTTSDTFVMDPAVARAIGEKAGVGKPTDANGWAIWEVSL